MIIKINSKMPKILSSAWSRAAYRSPDQHCVFNIWNNEQKEHQYQIISLWSYLKAWTQNSFSSKNVTNISWQRINIAETESELRLVQHLQNSAKATAWNIYNCNYGNLSWMSLCAFDVIQGHSGTAEMSSSKKIYPTASLRTAVLVSFTPYATCYAKGKTTSGSLD